MAFEIIGKFTSGHLSARRDRPASAMLVAERWVRSGVEDVRVIWNGEVFEPDGLRRRFELTPLGMKLRGPTRF